VIRAAWWQFSRGGLASVFKKSPHHNRIVAKDDHNDVDGEGDQDFNWEEKSSFGK
jgi:hypothetical protein